MKIVLSLSLAFVCLCYWATDAATTSLIENRNERIEQLEKEARIAKLKAYAAEVSLAEAMELADAQRELITALSQPRKETNAEWRSKQAW